MPYVDFHPSKGGIIAERKKTVTGKPAAKPASTEGESLRNLTWLTAADVRILILG
jgi:hypothetical protein